MQLTLIPDKIKLSEGKSPSKSRCRIYPGSLLLLFIFTCSVLHLVSCSGPNKMAYMRDIVDTSTAGLVPAVNLFETPIQKNDQLWITVGGTNIEDIVPLNSASGIIQGSNITPVVGNSNAPVMGYLVEGDGTVKLPYLDKVKAEGLTRLQLEKHITERLKEYTKNPVVNVRFLNYRVTVMGAVQAPGSFSLPTERVTVLEALGLAGDLTIFGKRDNVLVIREQNGKRTFGRIDLRSKTLFNSPYYYLKTNDVVYVEASKASSIQRERVPEYIGMFAGVLSLVISLVAITQN